jgi:hypothetical protein
VRIDSSGNVGVGNTVASTIISAAGLVSGSLVVGSGSGQPGVVIYGGASNTSSLFFADGTTGADTFRGYVEYNHTDNFLRFGSNTNERLRIDSSGNVGIGTTPNAATKLDVSGAIRASTGVLFGSDTAAANTLDDYEEGTWTPAFASGGTFTYSAARGGTYTKIGNQVKLEAIIAITGISGGTATYQVDIQGIPFSFIGTSFSGSGVGVVFSVIHGGITIPANYTGPFGAVMQSNAIQPYFSSTNGAAARFLQQGDLAGSAVLQFSCVYTST